MWERQIRLKLADYEEDLESDPRFSSPVKETYLTAREVTPHYPWRELEVVSKSDPTPELRPLAKTEFVRDGGEAEPATVTKEIQHTVNEPPKLQEKFSRQATETETESNTSNRFTPNWMGFCNSCSIYTHAAVGPRRSNPPHWVLFTQF